MSRLARSLSSAALLMAASLVSAHAQAASTVSLQTVSSPSGYQYQVPADWQQIPDFTQQKTGSQTVTTDGEVASADGNEQARVVALSGLGITAGDLSNLISSYLTPPPNLPAGVPVLTVTAQPSSVQVSGADAAEEGTATYADPSGNQHVVDVRAALAGQTVYVLTMDIPQSFYQSDASYGQIVASFQVVSAASAAASS